MTHILRSPCDNAVIHAAAEAILCTREIGRVVLRTRAQIVLLAGEQQLRVSAIAPIVREATQTVRNWLKRWMAEGIEGLKDRPMPGAPTKITQE